MQRKKHNTKYSPEFKISVIMDMRENHLGYNETVRKYGLGVTESGGARQMLHRWERIYLEEERQDSWKNVAERKAQADRGNSLWINLWKKI